MKDYEPPYERTPKILRLVSEISETIGRYSALNEQSLPPQLRQTNRIHTIQASLSIEQNTLSLEQVTAVLDGKKVLGPPKEIQEVRNAFAAYEPLENGKSHPLRRVHARGTDRINSGSLEAFECKWQAKKHSVPGAWKKAYPETPVQFDQPENFMDFLI